MQEQVLGKTIKQNTIVGFELIGKRDAKSMRPTMVVNNVNGVLAIRKGSWKYIEGIPAASLKEGAKKFLAAQLTP